MAEQQEDPKTWEQTLELVETGMLGFETLRHFRLSADAEQAPFYILQSEEDENISFVVIEPAFIMPDYAFDLSDEDAQTLAIQQPDDALVLVLVSIPENPAEMSANLLGPLIFNKESFKGKQVVLENAHYSVRHLLFPDGMPTEDID